MAEKRSRRKLCDLDQQGEVFLADEVLLAIAALAASEVEGVCSLPGGGAKLGAKKAVKVETDKEGLLVVDLTLSLSLNAQIPQVSKRVQERVKSTIENMTGLEVREVNIHIAGVSTEQE